MKSFAIAAVLAAAVSAQNLTTSTVFAYNVVTVSACASTVTNCPYTTAPVVVTRTFAAYTTVCPVGATVTFPANVCPGGANCPPANACPGGPNCPPAVVPLTSTRTLTRAPVVTVTVTVNTCPAVVTSTPKVTIPVVPVPVASTPVVDVCPGGANCPSVATNTPAVVCPGGPGCPSVAVATPAVVCPGGAGCPGVATNTPAAVCPGGASCPGVATGTGVLPTTTKPVFTGAASANNVAGWGLALGVAAAALL